MVRGRVLLSVSVLVLAGVGAAVPAEAKTPSCLGKKATIVSSSKSVVKGTAKNDVIVATGKGVTVLGLGGQDRICATKPRLIDGGADPDQIKVPQAALKTATIKTTSGDVVNGVRAVIGQPFKGAPTFEFGTDYFMATATPHLVFSVAPIPSAFHRDPMQDGNTNVNIAVPAAAPGRTLATWSLDFGDGSPVLRGVGSPPDHIHHAYLGTAMPTLTAVVTDNLGASTTHTQVINTAPPPNPTVALVTQVPAGNPVVTFALGMQSPVARALADWGIYFGDGTEQLGTGALPASIGHTYAAGTTVGGPYSVTVITDDVDGRQGQASTTVSTTGTTPTLVDYHYSYQYSSLQGRQYHYRYGDEALHLTSGQPFVVSARTAGFDKVEVDFSDGRGWQDSATTSTGTSYSTPGNYVVTVRGIKSGSPDVTHTYTVVVSPLPELHLSLPTSVPEGNVTGTFSWTTAPAQASWVYIPPGGHLYRTGIGNPGSITLPTRANSDAYGELYVEQLPALSASTTPTLYGYIYHYLGVVPAMPTLGDLHINYGYDSVDRWGFGTTGPSQISQPYFSVPATFEAGLRDKKVRTTFGDGATSSSSSVLAYSFPTSLGHAYATPGDKTVTVALTDTKNHTATTSGVISIAGVPTVTTPADQTIASGSTAVMPLSATAGTNAAILGYELDYGDGTAPAQAYGALPASVSHVYTGAATRTCTLYVFDDHGYTATVLFQIKVT